VESQRGDEWRDEQFVKLSRSAFDEIQKANNSMDANSSDFRMRFRKGERREENRREILDSGIESGLRDGVISPVGL
jgi:hypothetical protein